MEWIILLASIVNFLFGFLIIRKASSGFLKTSFAIFVFFASLWVLSNFIFVFSPTTFLWKTTYALGSLVLSSSLIWVLYFSRQKRLPTMLLYGIYIIGFLLFSLCYINNFFLKELIIEKSRILKVPGPFLFLYSLYMLGVLVFNIYKLTSSLRNFKGIKKQQSKYILLGVIGFGFTSFLVSFLLPLFGVTKFAFLDSPSSLFFVGFASYAIIRYRLMDINIIIKKGFVYAILSGFTTAIWVVVIIVLEKILRNITGYASLITAVIAAITITVTFQPLRARIEKLTDKIFFKGKYDYQKTVREFTRSLITVLDLRELLNLIASIAGTINVKETSVLLLNENTKQYEIKCSVGLDNENKKIKFDNNSSLIRFLKREGLETKNKNIKEKDVVIKEEIDKISLAVQFNGMKDDMESIQSAICVPILIKGQLKGILSLGDKLSGDIYSEDDIALLTTLADEAGIAIDNANLYGDIKRNYFDTIRALAQAVDAKDTYTRGHSDRVTQYAVEIAKRLGVSREDIQILQYAGILHDIGKIGVIEEILKKAGPLTPEEREIMQSHPIRGEEIIRPAKFLEPVLPLIRHHHERFDGKGYPDGSAGQMEGENIPLGARILAVADTFDAMTSTRPYRKALSMAEAIAEIKRNAGTQFDPQVAKAFIDIYMSKEIADIFAMEQNRNILNPIVNTEENI